VAGQVLDGEDPRVRTVYSATPLGNIPIGEEITVSYYVGDYSDETNEIQEPVEPLPDEENPDEPTDGEPQPGDVGNEDINDAPAADESTN